MRVFSKINRGILLTVAVIIAVAIYLVVNYFYQQAQIPEIKDICEKYVSAQVKYSMLPEKYRDIDSKISQAELDTYLSQMEADVGAFYPSDFKGSTALLKEDLINQSKGIKLVHNFSKSINSYKKFEFIDNSVSVTFVSDTVYDGYSIMTGKSDKLLNQTEDKISLQKVDGKWKVVYSDIQRYTNKYTEEPSMRNKYK